MFIIWDGSGGGWRGWLKVGWEGCKAPVVFGAVEVQQGVGHECEGDYEVNTHTHSLTHTHAQSASNP